APRRHHTWVDWAAASGGNGWGHRIAQAFELFRRVMTGSRPFSNSLAAPAARLLAMVAGAAAITAAVAGTSIAASGASPTLQASNHVAGLPAVVYGSSIRLSGRANLTGSRTFSVQAEAWPFKSGFTTISSGKTTGDYS